MEYPGIGGKRFPDPIWVLAWIALAVVHLQTCLDSYAIIQASDGMSQGLIAPFIAAFIASEKWPELQRLATQPSWAGLPILIVSAAIGVAGALGESTTLGRLSLLVGLIGMVQAGGGRQALRLFRFPIALLVFVQPIPVGLYGRLTLPLQLMASQLAELELWTLGYAVLREGNVLEFATHRVSVAEACSGLRSLLALTFLLLVYAYYFEKSVLKRIVLMVAVIPAAIFFNSIRVSALGVLSQLDRGFADGPKHEMLGWIVFALAFTSCVAAHQCLRRWGRMAA